MTTTVRLDDSLAERLDKLSTQLHKKKSEVIRDAIVFYATNIEKHHKSRIQKAVEKVMDADRKENGLIEGTLYDGL